MPRRPKPNRCATQKRQLQAQVESHQNELRMAEERLAHGRSELARADKQHRQLEARLTRCRERIAVLTELEQRLEGLDGGMQEVLRMAQQAPDGPLGEVCGVVADLFHVDVDTAHLVEAALGERAQFVVVAVGCDGSSIGSGNSRCKSPAGSAFCGSMRDPHPASWIMSIFRPKRA